jgi:hypothetical protein
MQFSPPYYLGLGILLVLMVVALVKAYQMWEELHDVEEPDSPIDLLESFEEAHAALGRLSQPMHKSGELDHFSCLHALNFRQTKSQRLPGEFA